MLVCVYLALSEYNMSIGEDGYCECAVQLKLGLEADVIKHNKQWRSTSIFSIFPIASMLISINV